jgi:hypothetical protein
MGTIKYKSKLPFGPDNKPLDGKDLEFPVAHTPSRKERQRQQRKNEEFGNYDDIKPMLRKVGGTMVSQTEHLPQGDTPTYYNNEWTKLNEKSYNRNTNTYYTWH